MIPPVPAETTIDNSAMGPDGKTDLAGHAACARFQPRCKRPGRRLPQGISARVFTAGETAFSANSAEQAPQAPIILPIGNKAIHVRILATSLRTPCTVYAKILRL
jgi:hypothetical protein